MNEEVAEVLEKPVAMMVVNKRTGRSTTLEHWQHYIAQKKTESTNLQ